MKKILILMGSSKFDGNTAKLTKSFIKGAESNNKIVTYVASQKNILECRDCKNCFKNSKGCSSNDDFNELVPLIESSDIIVFITPLYFFSFPMKLKAIIDKFYSFLIGRRAIDGKESILIVCGGSKNIENFNGIVFTYESIIKLLNWKNKKIIKIAGIYDNDDLINSNYLKEVEIFAKKI